MNSTVKKALFIDIFFLCLTPYMIAPVALVLGIAFTNIWGQPFPKLSGKMTSMLLKASIVGLGFGMNLNSAIAAGKDGFGLTIASISIV